MAANEWFIIDLVTLYNLSWLLFLTHKHYGKVTTTAGHIFELNVLLNMAISNILLIFLVDLKVFSLGFIPELLDFGFLVAIAGSQIETMVFLKTLTVNTMMTNTAGIIIMALTIFSNGLALIITLAWPSTMVRRSEVFLCAPLTPMAMDYKRKFIMLFVSYLSLVIVLSVMVFGVFRGLQMRRTNDNEELPDDLSLEEHKHETEVSSRDTLSGTPSQERLFTVQAMIAELHQETPRGIVEEDLMIQDIELNSLKISPFTDTMNISETKIPQNQETTRQRMESSPSKDHVMMIDQNMNSNTLSEVQQVPFGCATGINLIMKTIQKYMKNTMINLLILTCLLPWYSTELYGFITNSGCENPTIKSMTEMSEYGWYIVTILLPILIKLKLDRLSE